jgi:hypothetical protein
MRSPSEFFPFHDSRNETIRQLTHAALEHDEEAWRRCEFAGLQIVEQSLCEVRLCPSCHEAMTRPTRFSDAARALAGRLSTHPIPPTLEQVARILADWATHLEAAEMLNTLAQQTQTGKSEQSSQPDEAELLRIPVGMSLKEVERRLILAALDWHAGSRSETAKALGLSRRTLYNKLLDLRRKSQQGSASERHARPAHHPVDEQDIASQPQPSALSAIKPVVSSVDA